VPSPFVVELNEHPQGDLLQGKLAEMTGRKTVPNVLINGKSIGGGDEVAELDQTMKLIDKIKSLGGKQMQVVQENT
jgi:glutaredoxin